MSLRPSRLFAGVAAALLLPLAAPSLARADAVPPDVYACDTNAAPGHFDSSKVGSACKLSTGESGACQKSTCSGIDYAHWDRDASASPPSVQFDCLKCAPGAPSSSSSSGSSSDGGCALAPTSPLRSGAPWLVALVVPALAFLTRKKKDRTRP